MVPLAKGSKPTDHQQMPASPFIKVVKRDFSMEVILELLESEREVTMSHNLTMFIYLMTNKNVLLISNEDMHSLLDKMFCFTTAFNKPMEMQR